MSRRSVIIVATVAAALGLGAMAATGKLSGGKKDGPKAVAVVRGSLVDKALATAGVERRVALEVTDVHSLLDMVAYGLGVALVPQSFAAKTDRARFIGLADDVAAWETVSVTSDPTSAAAGALLKAVRQAKSGRRIS